MAMIPIWYNQDRISVGIDVGYRVAPPEHNRWIKEGSSTEELGLGKDLREWRETGEGVREREGITSRDIWY